MKRPVQWSKEILLQHKLCRWHGLRFWCSFVHRMKLFLYSSCRFKSEGIFIKLNQRGDIFVQRNFSARNLIKFYSCISATALNFVLSLYLICLKINIFIRRNKFHWKYLNRECFFFKFTSLPNNAPSADDDRIDFVKSVSNIKNCKLWGCTWGKKAKRGSSDAKKSCLKQYQHRAIGARANKNVIRGQNNANKIINYRDDGSPNVIYEQNIFFNVLSFSLSLHNWYSFIVAWHSFFFCCWMLGSGVELSGDVYNYLIVRRHWSAIEHLFSRRAKKSIKLNFILFFSMRENLKYLLTAWPPNSIRQEEYNSTQQSHF